VPTTQERFSTPTPITLRLRNPAGSVEVVASPSTETTVEITSRAEDPAVVELSGDGRTLTIEPRQRRLQRHGIDMVVHLPEGSDLRIHSAAAEVRITGSVGDVEVDNAAGKVNIEEAKGAVELGSASGTAKVGSTGGSLSFRSASGSLQVQRVGGACTARTASGSLTIGLADDDVDAHSVSGSVVVREAHRGSVDVGSTSGKVAVGVRRGTLVWLDVSSLGGRTTSALASEDPADTAHDGAPLTVRARSVSGNVEITSSGTGAIAL
jgi:DUF4097 and DUF4098 domain-containing protein YvlB